MKSPSPSQIRSTREAAGLTQNQAAALLHSTRNAWAKWESGARQMHPAMWELLTLKLR